MEQRKLKRTPVVGKQKKKRNVVQTAWALPVAKRYSPPRMKMRMPSPPDPDTYIKLVNVPPCVENEMDEVYLHNVNVVQRAIDRRQQKKISDLSNETRAEAEESYDSSFVDDSEADATKLT
jgi:hypothetical protein